MTKKARKNPLKSRLHGNSYRFLTGDVISRAAFGSSHEGRRIFELQKEMVKLVLELLQFIFIPGWRFVPTKANKRMKAYSEEVEFLLRGIIDQRIKAMRRGEKVCDDLLTTLLGSNSKSDGTHKNGNQTDKKMSIDDVIHEC
ncbi:cytochrome P450 [Striga asiatica]|uniref:Cytochrome P450 n=1 Tax=Striga asiatica TaxID=4170 RepID=A0A5A7PVP2_STRAF|nr:cytochrome P450 [Striga asiatica]